MFDSRILQPHGVQNDSARFRYAGNGISETGLHRQSFRGYAAQTPYIVQFVEFAAEPEGARRGDDGIFQSHSAEIYR